MCDTQSDYTQINVLVVGTVHSILHVQSFNVAILRDCVLCMHARVRIILVSVHIDRSIFEIIYR